MKLTGTWASHQHDLQLKFADDGTMALTSIDLGVFDQPTEYTVTDSGFSFRFRDTDVNLTMQDENTFTGGEI
ncbi:MAG: hypothetical protein IJX93_07315, partial [Clostridia bacterium]|nr:hypothetical protein [Clostridia bacterium]